MELVETARCGVGVTEFEGRHIPVILLERKAGLFKFVLVERSYDTAAEAEEEAKMCCHILSVFDPSELDHK